MSALNHEVLAFDLYGTLVDPIAISQELATLLNIEDANRVAQLWRQKQIEYSFRVTMMDRYENFEYITMRGLEFALATSGHSLDATVRESLVEKYDSLHPFPDAATGLKLLAEAGYEMVVLSNGTPKMIRSCIENSGLAEYFVELLSADPMRAFKPDRTVYRFAAGKLGCSMSEMCLVSCNAFDIVGASAAGMRTAWVNRSGGPFDTIGDAPDVTAQTITELAAVLKSWRQDRPSATQCASSLPMRRRSE
ncbi:haloacid dehalogenase type II [Actinopolymorpha pittospori]|uniref:2-haloacid dehalogenase n=1 Tax=Actinopolymorpha pittospori TaxID=648752 RepID=A0A927MZT9_9ACTN|nr:2-haloacid dehalogenase [Actinopolymorpha pittospori]